MNLLIDDCRNFNVDCIARNYETGMIVLRTEAVRKLYLDFDLAEKKTGLDILIDAGLMGVLPQTIILVTQNPVGLKQMQDFLYDNKYSSTRQVCFERIE